MEGLLNVDDADSDDDGHAGLGLDSETTWKAGLPFSFLLFSFFFADMMIPPMSFLFVSVYMYSTAKYTSNDGPERRMDGEGKIQES